jgi:hypothetical protein
MRNIGCVVQPDLMLKFTYMTLTSEGSNFGAISVKSSAFAFFTHGSYKELGIEHTHGD